MSEKRRRLSGNQDGGLITAGPLLVDKQNRRALLNNKILPVPTCAFSYLETLARYSPEPVSYRTLVLESEQVDLDPIETQDLARLYIYILRKAVEEDSRKPKIISAVDGCGYKLEF